MIAIDPGITGAVAHIDGDGYATVHDLPTIEKKGKAKIKKMIDARALSDLIDSLLINSTDRIAIEQVSAMPGQGVSSMFSLGDTFGCLRGVCESLGGKVEFVRPQAWKKHYGLGSDKGEALERALFMFPELDHKLSRKKDHNRAEAVLIAQYMIESDL